MSLVIDALAALRHEVVVVSSQGDRGRPEEQWSEVTVQGRSVQCLQIGILSNPPVKTLLSCIRAQRIADIILGGRTLDLVLLYNTYLMETLVASSLAQLADVPLVIEVEDHPLARRRGRFNLKPLLDNLAWNYILPKASGFIAVSTQLAACLPPDQARTIVPGIVDSQLLYLSQRRNRPFSRPHRVAGYFGAISANKGADVLLAFSERLPPGWRLLVTGSGELAPLFQRASESRPESITFLGCVDEHRLYELMCDCDVVLIPQEGVRDGSVFPFKAFEYLVSGSHVISAHKSMLALQDLAFTVRWDGSVSNLLQQVEVAEEKFACERGVREHAIQNVVRAFSGRSVGQSLDRFFGQVAENFRARRRIVRGPVEAR